MPGPGPIRGATLSAAKAPDLPGPLFPEIPDPQKRAYIVTLAATGHYGKAAAAAGIDLKTGWNWRHAGEEAFDRALALAKELHNERLEQEIFRRAHEGVETPVYQNGRMVGTKMVYSDLLLIFAAKGGMPDKYRDRYEHTGRDGGPIQLQPVLAALENLTEDELVIYRQLVAKTQTKPEGK